MATSSLSIVRQDETHLVEVEDSQTFTGPIIGPFRLDTATHRVVLDGIEVGIVLRPRDLRALVADCLRVLDYQETYQ